MKLAGKTAIVTGRGAASVEPSRSSSPPKALSVVVNDLDPGPAKETVELIEEIGAPRSRAGSVTSTRLHRRAGGGRRRLLRWARHRVNNAGYTWDSVIQKTADEQWEAMIDIHLTAPFRLLRSASTVMREAAKKEAAEGRTSSARS